MATLYITCATAERLLPASAPEAAALFREVNLGATAIGTITADTRYASLAVEELSRLSGEPIVLAPNLIEATCDMGAFCFPAYSSGPR